MVQGVLLGALESRGSTECLLVEVPILCHLWVVWSPDLVQIHLVVLSEGARVERSGSRHAWDVPVLKHTSQVSRVIWHMRSLDASHDLQSWRRLSLLLEESRLSEVRSHGELTQWRLMMLSSEDVNILWSESVNGDLF